MCLQVEYTHTHKNNHIMIKLVELNYHALTQPYYGLR